MSGELAILNVSSGDTKLTFDPKKPAEVKRAASVVTDMIRRGFAILIEVGSDDKGPLYRRAQQFDPETAEYIIAGAPDDAEKSNVQETPSPTGRRRKGKTATTRVAASKARAIAVAPTSGG